MQVVLPIFNRFIVVALLSVLSYGCKDKQEVTPATQIEGNWRITAFIRSDKGKQVDTFSDLENCDKLAVWAFKGGKFKTTNTTPSCELSGGILDMDYEIEGTLLFISFFGEESFKLSFMDNTMTWSLSIDGQPGKIIFTRQ